MTGVLCLQGGREFTSPCRDMDALVIERSLPGPVAVLAGAARVGSDYAGAADRARRHYEALGAVVVTIPDPRADQAAALDTMTDDLCLIVLPGGSPSSLLDVLTGPIGDRLRELHHHGTAISGASAGAMVLCSHVARPDQGGDVVAGLDLVAGLALPHWQPGPVRWPVPEVTLWGLPECGGVLIEDERVIAVGEGTPSVRREGVWAAVPRSLRGFGTRRGPAAC